MSSSSRLPARPSLEQLRKQAKDLLRLALAGDDAALTRVRTVLQNPGELSLGRAQFVLAREYGFDTWAVLVRHVGASSREGLRRFEVLAQEVADAYASADVERLREINWVYGTSFRWDLDPDVMRRSLPSWFASETRTSEQALADARQLVAAMSGFPDWTALTNSLSTPDVTMHRSPSAETPFYRVDPVRQTIGVNGPLGARHWDTVVSVIREQRLTGVWAPGASDEAIERLSRVETLTRLYAGGGQISDEGLRHLSRFPGLEELSLGGPRSPITDRGLEVLGELSNLTRFWMVWAPLISDRGVANLAGCEQLEIVDLMGTQTGDGAIAAIAGKRRLRKLATGRLVTDAGAARLNELARFTTWQGDVIKCDLGDFECEPTHLLLDGPFSEAGLTRFADLDGLFGLNLFWHTADLTAAVFAAVASLPRLGFLRIDRDGAVTDAALTALSRSRTLQALACADTPHVTGRGLAALASMPLLCGLAVDCGNANDDGLSTLPEFPSLRTLRPGRLADEGFRHVGRCTRLEALSFHRDTTDAATPHIAALPNLKSLFAGGSQITDRSLAILAGMTSLETIDLHGCKAITDAGVSRLASLPGLSTVILHDCPNVTDAATATFPAHARIKRTPD
jgi:hypothetical protein